MLSRRLGGIGARNGSPVKGEGLGRELNVLAIKGTAWCKKTKRLLGNPGRLLLLIVRDGKRCQCPGAC
jgi:hypothetical protein